ncbi:cytosine permease [Mycolicibacterium sp. YH-1]|uniref:purine-cytosine permease family protein n=1 Tax=Mycolicibacterium sp. YH-1 TaxID=2908837 RepID=UPI001F4C0A32|nr:cytosine permease [Mycolicibacterium sp. YH-1]UNB51553.1 cytosine permease [Mycolicibacterium sp. YH-1]
MEDKGVETAIKDRFLQVEKHGIEYIPEDERRSRPSNLYVLLLGGSMTFGLFIIGWYPIAFGLGWWSAATSIVFGSAVGAVFLGLSGLMGPHSGTNNPVSSGAYFGVAGRLIGSFLEATASLAFAAISIWTGGDALASALIRYFDIQDNEAVRLGAYAVLSIIVTVISVYGHHIMMSSLKFILPTAGLCMIIGLFVYSKDFDASYPGTGSYAFDSHLVTWLISALLCAATVSSYAAYSGDWTRHISPKKFSDRRIVFTLFMGGIFGMGVCFLWGAFTSAAAFNAAAANADTPFVFGIVEIVPLWYIPFLLYLGLASGTTQAVINTYGTGLDTSAIIPRFNRVQATLLACALATALVYVGHFYDAVEGGMAVYLQLLVCFSIPWVVIIVYGHLRRRGYYNVDDLQVFNRREKGGVYWYRHGLNPRTLGLWTLSAAVGMLFSLNDAFTGALVPLMGGIDGGLVASGLVALIGCPIIDRLWPDRPEVYGPAAAPQSASEPVPSPESETVG